MLEVTVKRSEWYRGKGDFYSALLLEGSQMKCCLGFACLAAGLTEDIIRGVTSPVELGNQAMVSGLSNLVEDNEPEEDDDEDYDEDVGRRNTVLCHRLMVLNDGEDTTDAVREVELIKEGKKAGIAFTFVD